MTKVRELNLPVPKRPEVIVDDSVLRSIHSFGKACEKCAELGGFTDDKVLCGILGFDKAIWSRIKSDQIGVNPKWLFPLMDVCGNELPLMYLNYERGREPLPPLRQSELEREVIELKRQLEEAQRERKVIADFMREARAVNA